MQSTNSVNWNRELEDVFHDLKLQYTYESGQISLVNKDDAKYVYDWFSTSNPTCEEDVEYLEALKKAFECS